jgi:hypothetical protein
MLASVDVSILPTYRLSPQTPLGVIIHRTTIKDLQIICPLFNRL